MAEAKLQEDAAQCIAETLREELALAHAHVCSNIQFFLKSFFLVVIMFYDFLIFFLHAGQYGKRAGTRGNQRTAHVAAGGVGKS